MCLASLDYHYYAQQRAAPIAASCVLASITRWHASMAASARLGCPRDACDRHWLPLRSWRVASREALCSALRRPPLGCSRRQLSGAAKNAIASRATSLPVRRGSQPRTLHKKHRDSTSRRIASYTAAAAQRRYVNNLCCAAPRGLPRALPQVRQKLLPEREGGCIRAARTTAYGCDP